MLTANKPTASEIEPNANGSGNGMRRLTRSAGLLYLVIFVFSPFAFIIGRATIVSPGDAAATAQNLAEHEMLFRFGMVAESVVFLVEIVLAALLYVILRPVSRSMSLAAAFGRVGEAVIQAANLLTSSVALIAAGGAGYMAAFEPGQLDALVLAALEANDVMILVWGLFFALHLAIVGYLVYRSGFFPRILGVLLMLASLGYFAESYAVIVSPQTADLMSNVVLALAIPGELVFALWLIIKGVDTDAWNERRLRAAVV